MLASKDPSSISGDITSGEESWGGSHPSFSSLFCLVLPLTYLSHPLVYSILHDHFLTTYRDKFYWTPLERRNRTNNKTSRRKKWTCRRCLKKEPERKEATRKEGGAQQVFQTRWQWSGIQFSSLLQVPEQRKRVQSHPGLRHKERDERC